MDAQVMDAIVRGALSDPFAVLGMHEYPDHDVVVRVFHPYAQHVSVLDAVSGQELAVLARVHEGGVFAGFVPGRRQVFPYLLSFQFAEGTWVTEDPYRFPPVLPDSELWAFAHDQHPRPYLVLGAHPMALLGVEGVRFAVWAPNAKRVSVVGDFNQWDGRRHVMRRRLDTGVWEIFLPEMRVGERYKYEVMSSDGHLLPLKADPYGFAAEKRPANATVYQPLQRALPNLSAERQRANALDAPISIYEVHLGSWRRQDNGDFLDWDGIAEKLIPYVREMGFTHLEFLPVSEHPFDGSWGYQPVGLYAPTSRFGSMDGFRRLVRDCQAAGLGVLLDWVPAHFPTDGHGLGFFDGTHQYEHADPRQGFHRDWNTYIYNYGRSEVSNYLRGNALYWLEQYGVDGLRVDAVASMLYLDYSRQDGEWIPNAHGGRENLEAIAFLQRLTSELAWFRPGSMVVAEESTAWPKVTRSVAEQGLGFNYKWNMGWMHDTLSYMKRDPLYRAHHHRELTFGLVYAFDENFILPISHDEVVHGKGSVLTRMPGERWQQFANLRAYYGFMFAHPGKKLLFMGAEFAQIREWNHDTELDWSLLNNPMHQGVQRLVRDLNQIYRATPALHELDTQREGFIWINHEDAARNTLSFVRQGRAADRKMVVVCNFAPVLYGEFRVGVPEPGFYQEKLNTDAGVYGGGHRVNGVVLAENVPADGMPWSVLIKLPPMATVFFEWKRDS